MPRAGGRTEGSEAQPHWGEHRNPAVRTAATQERCLTKPKCGAVGLRACGCQSPLAAEAALRHSDARPGGAALRMTPGSSAGSCLMRWVWTPFMGRCLEPVAGRRDPKRSPTGASIEMARQRPIARYGPMSLWHHMASRRLEPPIGAPGVFRARQYLSRQEDRRLPCLFETGISPAMSSTC
ncbi:hypothetical protein EGU54_18175 [Achromobacter aegrifaciens]|nr:hypothetical protein EGU54_18175 [Achromobacter aegrifaciens]